MDTYNRILKEQQEKRIAQLAKDKAIVEAMFSIDMYDVELNPNGVICCDNCQSILMCRKAWDYLYKESK
jgi:hypothetical protein